MRASTLKLKSAPFIRCAFLCVHNQSYRTFSMNAKQPINDELHALMWFAMHFTVL